MTDLIVIFTGVLVGLLLRYAFKGDEPTQYHLVQVLDGPSDCSESTFGVGEKIQLNTRGDNFLCSVSGKVFRDNKGNFIRSTVNLPVVVWGGGNLVLSPTLHHVTSYYYHLKGM